MIYDGRLPFFVDAIRVNWLTASTSPPTSCTEMEIALNKPIERGVFGADMKVELLNDGPVTIFIDSKNRE